MTPDCQHPRFFKVKLAVTVLPLMSFTVLVAGWYPSFAAI